MRPSALALCLLILGCNAPDDLREWRASDHDHTSEPGNNQVEVPPEGGPTPELAAHGLDEVTLVAWQQNCTRCHGTIGRGDGPQGPGMRATDLTDPNWQAGAKDEQIARTIRDGRGLMPAFPLPDSTLQGLVRLIRLLDASRARGPASAEAPSSVPPAPSGARPTPSGKPRASATSRAPRP